MPERPDESPTTVRRRLADGMAAQLDAAAAAGREAGYTRGHVDRCLAVVDACLAKLAPPRRPSEDRILAAVRRAVVDLNVLNERCDRRLIETDQGEDLRRLLLLAARAAGLKAEGDVTEAWREW